MNGPNAAAAPRPSSPKLVLTRVAPARIEDVWAMWTTKEGIVRWWSPEVLVTTVRKLDVRAGGKFELAHESAVALQHPESRRMFEEAGVPTSFVTRGAFVEVTSPRHLAFNQFVDLGPRVRPYKVFMKLNLRPATGGVAVELTAEAVPSAHWANLGERSLNQQLDRLVSVLAQ